jgi:hypothetical protein
MKKYYPYPANNGKKKYYIITSNDKKVYFGSYGMNDYTTYYKSNGKDYANERKKLYRGRHNKEDWSNPDKPAYWAVKYLWSYPTKEEAYEKIKKDLLRKGKI